MPIANSWKSNETQERYTIRKQCIFIIGIVIFLMCVFIYQAIRQHRILRSLQQSDPRIRNGDACSQQCVPPRMLRLPTVQS